MNITLNYQNDKKMCGEGFGKIFSLTHCFFVPRFNYERGSIKELCCKIKVIKSWSGAASVVTP